MKQLRPYQQQAVNECWDALKKNDEPVLLMASVGAGKSLMLASILLSIQNSGKRALCLVNNAELVRNNCATFNEQGGNSSIYCAALASKDTTGAVIFGTPQSVLNGINKNEDIGRIRINLIIVDEAHTINYRNSSSCFMRILKHFKQEYPEMRLLGATGTNFRFKGEAIVGDVCLFKNQVGNITTDYLVKNHYLIEPSFQVDDELLLDFSKVQIKQNGQFDAKELAEVVEKSARLTKIICQQVIHIMKTQNRFGVFIFATTRKHAEEILSHLPMETSALILGDTPQEDRTRILNDARSGKIKYLVNIAIISVGVDIPSFDTIAYLRPTESLVLLTQTMGRVLRLSPETNKTESLVLDFAGNIERHRDWDNPIIQKAVADTIDKDKPFVILCPQCAVMNTENARRCIGVNEKNRCDYYFEFKECENPDCKVKNDITARHCRNCERELIDPNAKLKLDAIKSTYKEVQVLQAKYGISGTQNKFRVNCAYRCRDINGHEGMVFEHYTPCSEKAKNMFYGQFVRKHCEKSSDWYPHLQNRHVMEQMLHSIKTPMRLLIAPGNGTTTAIKKKFFE